MSHYPGTAIEFKHQGPLVGGKHVTDQSGAADVTLLVHTLLTPMLQMALFNARQSHSLVIYWYSSTTLK